MKCTKCNSEWNTSLGLSKSLTLCPFCGAKLEFDVMHSFSSIEEVLTEIIAQFGLETLKDGGKTVALVSDLSPNMKHERLLLSYLIQSDGNKRLLEVRDKSPGEQYVCFQKVCQYMIEEQFVSKDAAIKICKSFAKTIGLTIQYDDSPIHTKQLSSCLPTADSIDKESAGTSKKTSANSVKSSQNSLQTSLTIYSGNSEIITLEDYRNALEKYFIKLGKQSLTVFQMMHFLTFNSLDEKWRIGLYDVQNDLIIIYRKYNISEKQAIANLTVKPSIQIHTLEDYKDALENWFLYLGKEPLSEKDIMLFLCQYSLKNVWRITVGNVQSDLKQVYAKYAIKT